MSSWLNENKIKILKKSSQFPDLKSVDEMWKELKYKVHDTEATNMTDLIKFRKEKNVINSCWILQNVYGKLQKQAEQKNMQPKIV